MKPYPEYKPTGLAWLPEIPKHWTTRKIKYIFRERSEKGYPDEPLLAATQNHGVIPKSLYGARTVEAQKDLHLLKLVRVGDFVISLRSFQGGIEYAYYQGIISPAYTIMIPDSCLIDSGYFRYLAKSPNFIALLQTCVTGIREGQNIDYSTLRRHSLPLPPADEQAQIVRYLDAMTAKINKLIRAKKRQIALLQEQKQAIINQAVTRGLDPDVELKDSGIDWLGPIPKHWDCRTIRRCSRYVKTGGTPSGVYEDYFQEDGFNWYTPGDLGEELWLSDSIRQLSELGKSQVKIFPPNTIMMIGIGGTIGKVAICSNSASCNQQISGIVVSEDMNVIYVAHCLKSLRNYILSTGKYTTLPIINQEEIKTLNISIPPLDEQNKISKFLCSKTQRFEKILKKIKKEIGIILEYKNSLIASVITGQVDVRNIAVEEVDPADLIAETDDDPTGEESPEESEE